MAPAVRTASRLSALFCLIVLVIHVWCKNAAALIAYDRQSLLDIGASYEALSKQYLGQQDSTNFTPPFLSSIPAFLRRLPCANPRRKRLRRRGRRGGVLVRLRSYLKVRSRGNGYPGELPSFSRSQRATVARMRWISPVAQEGCRAVDNLPLSAIWYFPRLPKTEKRGVDRRHIRKLARAQMPRTERTVLRLALLNTRSISNKTFLLNDFFTSRGLDFMFLTETWLHVGECSAFSELLPPNCSFFSSPRTSGKGGGLATVFKSAFQCCQSPSSNYSSFEMQLLKIQSNPLVVCALVYRPPKFNKDFIQDFSDFLAGIVTHSDRLLIVGDFNIHVCCENKPLVKDFLNMIDSFNLTQWVCGPTHEKGHTLDLVLSLGLDVHIEEICDTQISDHLPVLFSIALPGSVIQQDLSVRSKRVLSSQSVEQFCNAFLASVPSTLCVSDSVNTDDSTALFDSTCLNILDAIAPLVMKRSKHAPEPWHNETTRALRRDCRRAERKWNKDKLHVSLVIFRDCLANYQRAVKSAKAQFMSNFVSNNSHRPQVLFNVLNQLVNPKSSPGLVPSDSLCNNFLSFFVGKISQIRESIVVSPCDDSTVTPVCTAVFDEFMPVSLDELSKVVQHLRPSNCPLDVVPACFMKRVFSAVGPYILNVLNSSLLSGRVPGAFKQAVVQPLLKKPSLDPNILANYRPISKLPFLGKVLEKIVNNQLQSHLDSNGIFEKFQSGFKTLHSTETALLRVLNDLLLTVDSGCPVILVLLDLSAAFDTVDHCILLSRLEQFAGFKGTALNWFGSYLRDRYFSVHLGPHKSTSAPLHCGVPQGSVLGPALFSLYMLPLGSILKKHNIAFHFYADDLQIYLPLKPASDSVDTLLNCLQEVKTWLGQNFLILNEKKTEIVVFSPKSPAGLDCALGPLSPYMNDSLRNLGVILDSSFKMDKQINSVIKASFYQLRILSKVKAYLPASDFERVIHLFISSRLDYCNSLYCGLDQSSLQRLQQVQNAAARLLTGTRKREPEMGT